MFGKISFNAGKYFCDLIANAQTRGIPQGSICKEVNTGTDYMFINGAWQPIGPMIQKISGEDSVNDVIRISNRAYEFLGQGIDLTPRDTSDFYDVAAGTDLLGCNSVTYYLYSNLDQAVAYHIQVYHPKMGMLWNPCSSIGGAGTINAGSGGSNTAQSGSITLNVNLGKIRLRMACATAPANGRISLYAIAR